MTFAGDAGASPTHSLLGDPTSVGGPGGVTTVSFGSDYAGQTLWFAVGGTEQGSALQDSDAVMNLLAVAGGGGQGGYAGRFDLPDQIFATYPGGEGGAPSGPGIAPGGDPASRPRGRDAAHGATSCEPLNRHRDVSRASDRKDAWCCRDDEGPQRTGQNLISASRPCVILGDSGDGLI